MKRAANAVAPATAVGSDCPVDLDLVTRIAVGDSAALDALYARYSSPVRALVRKILPRAEDADEVVLDVFWQVWRQADRYDGSRGAPPAWIFAIARSRAIDRRRVRLRREDRTISFDDPVMVLDPLDERALPDQVASLRQTRDLMREAVRALSSAQRQAVELAFFEGLTHAEIATKLNQPIGTIKTRIRQGLIQLRKKLD